MTEKSVAVLRKNDKFLAGVFTPEGLFSLGDRAPTETQAISSAEGTGLHRSNLPAHLSILEKAFVISEGTGEVDVTDVVLDMSGLTEKACLVLKAALKIPRGQTVSYGELAKRAGIPGAARFVGNVMANNRFCPIVPCHRVVSSTGIGGYGRDVKRKIELLKLEGAIK